MLLAPTLIPSSPAGATFPGDNGKIVLRGTDGDDEFDILKVDPQGGPLVSITDTNHLDLGPQVSPNGERVAFTRAPPMSPAQVFIAKLNGDGVRQITRGPGSPQMPTWTPSGRTIVFTRRTDDGEFDLFKVRIGPEPRRGKRLTDTAGLELEPEVSSDGLIVFSYSPAKGSGGEIIRMHLDGSGRRRLTDTDNKVEAQPTWAPGGNKVAFSVQRPMSMDTSDIAMVRADGSHRRKLLDSDDLGFQLPTWSPNGDQIAATASNASSEMKIVRFPSDDGAPLRNVTTFNQGGTDPGWQPLP